jgi:hypothetical protein
MRTMAARERGTPKRIQESEVPETRIAQAMVAQQAKDSPQEVGLEDAKALLGEEDGGSVGGEIEEEDGQHAEEEDRSRVGNGAEPERGRGSRIRGKRNRSPLARSRLLVHSASAVLDVRPSTG